MSRSWRVIKGLHVFARETRGTAAVEMALWTVLLVVPLLSVTDLGIYIYRRMQVELAAQSAAAAAWKLCSSSTALPASKNCATLLATMTTAAQSTSLGTGVTIKSGSPIDGYYCVNASNVLVQVGTTAVIGGTPTKPSPFNCSTVVTGSVTQPGEYLQVSTSYTFTDLFTGLSITGLLPSPIEKTAWMRLG
jgi:Flp pilus assembly protein TadG